MRQWRFEPGTTAISPLDCKLRQVRYYRLNVHLRLNVLCSALSRYASLIPPGIVALV